jgi:hypothetical protein
LLALFGTRKHRPGPAQAPVVILISAPAAHQNRFVTDTVTLAGTPGTILVLRVALR